jgi:hypothetical protein
VLTEEEKDLVLQVTELVADPPDVHGNEYLRWIWGCDAFDEVAPQLKYRYCAFFDKPCRQGIHGIWTDAEGFKMRRTDVDWRILCLLLFAEAG